MTKLRNFVKLPITATFGRTLSAECKETLAAYCFHANDRTGETFVSAETIAAALGISVRQVQRHRAALCDAGFMVPKGSRRTKSGHLTRRFQIVYKASSDDVSNVSLGDAHSLPTRHRKAGNASSDDVSNASPGDARSRCTTEIDDSEVEEEVGLFSLEEAPGDLEIAKATWNELAQELGLSQVSHLTDARKSKLRARLREGGGISGWKIALDKIRRIPWMLGENDLGGWRVNFDYVLRAEKFAALMEGQYDQAHGRRRRSAGEENRAAFAEMIARADHEATNPHDRQEDDT
jgi:hypothetical protein